MDQKIEASISSHFKDILDALSDGVYISDISGTTLFVNRKYEELTGLRREEIEGRDVRDLVRSGIFDSVLNPEIVRSLRPATRVQHLKDGKTLVLSGFPVFDEGGDLCFVVTFARDITILTNLNDQVALQKGLLRQTEGQIAFLAKQQKDSTFMPSFASKAMAEVVSLVERIAPTDATVLVLGETGVGKDVIAHLLHQRSPRRDNLLLKVDCGGISEGLTESELFGYVAGAFTGASTKGKAGYFEIANGSTIFLDEIGELPISMQTRLLRVLQDGEIMRVGSTSPRKVDVRVIAATNRNLKECIKEGTFRSDLYYRLNVATVRIPPLRERPEDIEPLAKNFLASYAAKYRKHLYFMDASIEMLRSYSWPGNVRELQNLVHSMAITAKGPAISPQELPAQITGRQPEENHFSDYILTGRRSLREIMQELEADFLNRAIERYGSVQKVAEIFQVDRSTIFRKIRQSRKERS
ncbi:MAG: sigma 54-interacting transcriptional regulator [Desulfovibrionaceae bacterium]|nr:sigma 54-interacting transcriptional regulator [Desulfovibrionaceae bacterium]